jgi:magnesium-transporting ATPase (P-type)
MTLVTVPRDAAERARCAGLSPEQLYAALATRPQGLSQAEAEERLRRFGPNALQTARGPSLATKFLANLTHLMAVLLWCGGLIAFIAGMPPLGIAIWLVNLINGAFSFWQEYKAEKASQALRRLLPVSARVLRDGGEQRVPAEALVPGDLMLLAEGDRISADGRLVQEAELRVDQSTLTGESHPVRKTSDAVRDAALSRAETPNAVFAGTHVVAGTGKAVIFATGMASEFGTIAHLTQSVPEEPSPLQKELERVTRVVTVLAVGIGVLFFLLSLAVAGVEPATGFLFAMGMIVAFVPEGMLPTVTLSLALAVQRMARRHALVKRLSAVETLGCTTVICTDKTGTLTQNEMTVTGIWLPGHSFTLTGSGYSREGQVLGADGAAASPPPEDLRRLLVAALLCNNARLLPQEGGGETILGDPTEAALLVAASKAGLSSEGESRRQPRLAELPFDSRRKRMTTLHRRDAAGEPHSRCVAYAKGAPREVLARCSRIREGGEEIPLDDDRRARILAANDAYARGGLRVLAVALRELAEEPEDPSAESVEQEMLFLGLAAMHDPPRPEVAEAVSRCRRAGIRIVMITGDYGLTAESIARRIGILDPRGEGQGGESSRPRILNGAELDGMDDAALERALRGEVILARVAPEHKMRVVRILQEMGHIVAVTGDGVNDAPALKKADIGVAMGIAGTDVAREAADMILTDDNFAAIVNAVEEGRAIYANIRKFAIYVFNSNMAEAIPFIVMLFSRGRIPLPLTLMQVLAIDLGTDMVPAIGLGAEAPEAGVMDRPPRSRKEPLLHGGILARALLWYGLIEAVAAMSAYFFLNWRAGWPAAPLAGEGSLAYRMATTMTLAGVVMAQAGAVLGCRTDRVSVFRIGLFSNRLILFGIGIELLLLALLVYVPPLQRIFHTAPLGPVEWGYLAAWMPLVFLADEARKLLVHLKGRGDGGTPANRMPPGGDQRKESTTAG